MEALPEQAVQRARGRRAVCVQEPTRACVPGGQGWACFHEPFGRTADVLIPDSCLESGSQVFLVPFSRLFFPFITDGAPSRGGEVIMLFVFMALKAVQVCAVT